MNKNVIIGIVSKHYPIDKNRTDSFIRDEVKQAIFDNNAIAIGILSSEDKISFASDDWQDNLSKKETLSDLNNEEWKELGLLEKELERIILNKKYRDKHFGYNMWKWALSKFKCQKDVFSKKEKLEIFKMMKEEWNIR